MSVHTYRTPHAKPSRIRSSVGKVQISFFQKIVFFWEFWKTASMSSLSLSYDTQLLSNLLLFFFFSLSLLFFFLSPPSLSLSLSKKITKKNSLSILFPHIYNKKAHTQQKTKKITHIIHRSYEHKNLRSSHSLKKTFKDFKFSLSILSLSLSTHS